MINLQPTFTASPDRSDEDLVKDTRNGSDQAFELLMRRHSGTVRSLIARYFPDRFMVDDLAQETFVKAFFKLDSFRGDSLFVFWLKKIAVRVCLDQFRYSKTRANLSQKSLLPDDDEFERLEKIPTKESGKQIEARLLLEEILGSLNPMDRMIMVLFYGEGYEAKEIAMLMGLTRANVKIRAYRIRQRLNKKFAGGLG